MDESVRHAAAAANREVYNSGWTEIFVEGAPHLKHASLRALFARLIRQVYGRAAEHTSAPRVLDIGAGEGSVTRQLLELGARVTAVDVSSSQLAELDRKCEQFGDRLETHCGDVCEVLAQLDGPFDFVVASACLHHVPDYVGVIRDAIKLLTPAGQFLSFQDPLRYDSVSRFTRAFDELSYLQWRVFQGDLWGGLKRRLRRSRGVLDDSPLDNAEYHVFRGGVDQDAIAALLTAAGFECDVIRYFSTQSRVFQPLGTVLGVNNTFAIVARLNPQAER
ncbi:MAG: class I SAM-dependent methyltransferase [Pirellulales bacterium]